MKQIIYHFFLPFPGGQTEGHRYPPHPVPGAGLPRAAAGAEAGAGLARDSAGDYRL